MEKGLEEIYTKARQKSDKELLAGGAGIVSTGEQIILNPTPQQEEELKSDYERKKELIDKKIETARRDTIDKYNKQTKKRFIKNKYSEEQINNILKQKLLYHFKQEGLIVEIDGMDVYDIDKLGNGKKILSAIKSKSWKIENDNHHFSKDLVVSLLGDMPVISIKDYRKQWLNGISPDEMLKKPLFNIPREVKDVTDIEIIKNKEYYLNYWDIFLSQRIDQNIYFPLKDGDKISLIELYMAVKIFRDLKGYRDKSGKLMIFDYLKQEFVPVGIDILIKLKIFKNLALGIHQTLIKYCPHLLESGLLRLDDFKEKQKGREGSKSILRTEKRASSSRKFQVGFERVVYYLGGKYFNFEGEKILIKDIKAVDLDPDYIGIVRMADGREELIYRVLKVKDNERENLLARGASKVKVGNVIDLKTPLTKERIERYQVTDVIPRRPDESEEEYAERLKKLPDYKEVNAVTNELSMKTGVGIHNLPWREQIQIAQMSFESNFDENKKKRFIDFVKNYGLTGLRAFLSLEQGGLEMGEKILLIGERLEKDKADLIFERYAKLVDLTENVEEELKNQIENSGMEIENIDDVVIRRIAENVLLKAGGLLINFAGKLEKGENLNSVDIEKELEDYDNDLLFTFSVLKSLRGQLRLEDLEGVSFERVTAERYKDLKEEIDKIYKGEYTREDVENIEDVYKRERVGEIYDMFELYRKNYEDRQEFLKLLLEGFRGILLEDDEVETNLYLMKQGSRVVAFNRYDNVGGSQKRLGSCNVLHSVQALAIGGEVFKESLKREVDGDYEVNLATDAFSPEAGIYIEKGQFRVEQITDEFDPEDVWSFVMKRVKDSKRRSYYEGKDIIQEFRKQADDVERGEVTNRFVLEFDPKVDNQRGYIKELVNAKGFVITRYVFDKDRKKYYLGLERK